VASTKTHVVGLRELGEAMRLMNSEVSTKIARGAAAAMASLVKKRAVELAPQSDAPHQLGRRKGEVVQPGNLKRNIITKRLRPKDTELTAEYIVTVRRGKGRAPNDAFYGRFVEFGTVKMAPQPFLRPALSQNVGPATAAAKKRLASGIDAAARKAKKA
jgi:HK97 gp10 family phage protein